MSPLTSPKLGSDTQICRFSQKFRPESHYKSAQPQIPLEELTALPRLLAGFKGPTSKVRGGERREWREGSPLLFCGSTPMHATIFTAHLHDRGLRFDTPIISEILRREVLINNSFPFRASFLVWVANDVTVRVRLSPKLQASYTIVTATPYMYVQMGVLGLCTPIRNCRQTTPTVVSPHMKIYCVVTVASNCS